MLPSKIPSPLQAFNDEEIAQVELPDMQQHLHHNTALVQSAYKQLSAEATGGASLQDFAWAVSASAATKHCVVAVLWLCCAMLCCAMLCHAVLGCAMLCYAMPCHAVL